MLVIQRTGLGEVMKRWLVVLLLVLGVIGFLLYRAEAEGTLVDEMDELEQDAIDDLTTAGTELDNA